MRKVLLLFVVVLAVIHRVVSDDLLKTRPPKAQKDQISFMESFDSSDAVREKIRTEMEDYKRVKGMMLKKKLPTTKPTGETSPKSVVVADTQATSTEAAATSSPASTEPLVAAKQLIEFSTQSSSTEAPAVISSTIRQIALAGYPDDDSTEDPTTESNFDDTTISPDEGNSSHKVNVDDRFILNAPNICKGGRKPDASGKCRVVI